MGADATLALADAIIRMVASGPLEAPEELTREVAAAISAESPAFIADNSRLDLAVCTLLASALVFEPDGAGWADTFGTVWFARALASGLDALPQRAEARVQGLLAELQRLALSVAEGDVQAAHKRESSHHEIPAQKEGEAADAYTKRVLEVLAKTAESLARNAELDREELDALWWAFNARSELLGCAIPDGEPRAIAVASGVELGCLLKCLPAEAHRQLVTRSLPSPHSFVLRDFTTIERAMAARIGSKLAVATAKKYAAVFPLLWATLVAAEPDNRAGPTPPILEGDTRPLAYWARRALDETALARTALGK
jgi:hypothetical protein